MSELEKRVEELELANQLSLDTIAIKNREIAALKAQVKATRDSWWELYFQFGEASKHNQEVINKLVSAAEGWKDEAMQSKIKFSDYDPPRIPTVIIDGKHVPFTRESLHALAQSATLLGLDKETRQRLLDTLREADADD